MKNSPISLTGALWINIIRKIIAASFLDASGESSMSLKVTTMRTNEQCIDESKTVAYLLKSYMVSLLLQSQTTLCAQRQLKDDLALWFLYHTDNH